MNTEECKQFIVQRVEQILIKHNVDRSDVVWELTKPTNWKRGQKGKSGTTGISRVFSGHRLRRNEKRELQFATVSIDLVEDGDIISIEVLPYQSTHKLMLELALVAENKNAV